MQKKNQKVWEPTIHEQRAGTSGNPERRTMKEGGWETFNLAGRNRLTWEKRQREKQPKVEFENVGSRSLERRRIKGQLFKDTTEQKVNKRFLRKKLQKKKIMRNKEGTSHQCCWHNIGSGTQGNKWEESVIPRESQDDTIKEEAANNERHSTTMNQSRIIEKTLSEFKKGEKEREIPPGILKQPLEKTLGFKEI